MTARLQDGAVPTSWHPERVRSVGVGNIMWPSNPIALCIEGQVDMVTLVTHAGVPSHLRFMSKVNME